jgi:L-alanine-DL-glutamate epimerase-like enolase superfamily enzyme
MPPVRGAPDPKRDVEACRAVRERVGDEMVLMLDPYHHYTKEEALYIGRELELLGFYWLEEPMDEYDISSYVWLAERLTIPLVGPETAKGGLQTRAEWIVRGTADIIRGGVWNMGGITPLIKLAHLCEAHGLRLELHGADPGNLQVLGVMPIPGEFYERGLLHPLIDYEKPPPWLKERFDPMDREGWVHIPRKPGLGLEINWDYIAEYRAGG